MQKVLLLFIIASLNGPSAMFLLSGQDIIQGRVIDAETGEPLPFVNIVFNQKGTGTTISLDGYFSIDSRVQPDFLKLSGLEY
ncbi:MAG: carboxypeptidase-like regulatory domain-containing protein [Bacteroidales bacterium]